MSKPYADYVLEEKAVELRRIRQAAERSNLYLAALAGMALGYLVANLIGPLIILGYL